MFDLLQTYYVAFMVPFLALGRNLALASLVILGLTAGIKGGLLIIESLLDGSTLSESLPKLVRGAVIVMVLALSLSQWAAIQTFTLSFATSAVNVVGRSFTTTPSVPGAQQNPTGGGLGMIATPGAPPEVVAQTLSQRIIEPVSRDIMDFMARLWRYYELRTLIAGIELGEGIEPPENANLDEWMNQQIERLRQEREAMGVLERIQGAMSETLTMIRSFVGMVIGIVSGLIFSVFCLYYVIASLLIIMLALGVGPIAVALAPFDETYAKQAFEAALSGSVQMAIIVNLVALMSAIIARLTIALLNGPGFSIMPFSPGDVDAAVAMFIVPIMCIVFAFLIPRIVTTIMEIFRGGRAGTPSGAVRRIKEMAVAMKMGGVRAGAGGGSAMAGSGAKQGGGRVAATPGAGPSPTSGGATVPKPS